MTEIAPTPIEGKIVEVERPMTVKDLVEQLLQLDENLIVAVTDTYDVDFDVRVITRTVDKHDLGYFQREFSGLEDGDTYVMVC